MLFNGFALDVYPKTANTLYDKFEVGFANFYEGSWGTVKSNIPAFIRVKGYNNPGELKKIALFINYAQPFLKTKDPRATESPDPEQIECASNVAEVKCFFYDGKLSNLGESFLDYKETIYAEHVPKIVIDFTAWTTSATSPLDIAIPFQVTQYAANNTAKVSYSSRNSVSNIESTKA